MSAAPAAAHRARNNAPAPDVAMERQRIRDAMGRLLAGTPLHSDGKLTIKSLAEEAQLKRWMLTHKHVDLQDEFRARVDNQDKTPQALRVALDEVASLRARIGSLNSELAVERETVKRLERIVQVLTLEHDQLRRSETERANIVPIKRGSRE